MGESQTVLDLGVVLVRLQLMISVGMELKAQHFSKLALRGVFTAVNFLTAVPLLFGAVAFYRHWCGAATQLVAEVQP